MSTFYNSGVFSDVFRIVHLSYTTLLTTAIHCGFKRSSMNGPNCLFVIWDQWADRSIFVTLFDENIYFITFAPQIYHLREAAQFGDFLRVLNKTRYGGDVLPDTIIEQFQLTQPDKKLWVSIYRSSSDQVQNSWTQQELDDENSIIAQLKEIKTRLKTAKGAEKKFLTSHLNALAYIYLKNHQVDFLEFARTGAARKSKLF